jgi:large-conductance mechanosensitive channel
MITTDMLNLIDVSQNINLTNKNNFEYNLLLSNVECEGIINSDIKNVHFPNSHPLFDNYNENNFIILENNEFLDEIVNFTTIADNLFLYTPIINENLYNDL